MSCLSLYELPLADRRDIAIREAVRLAAERMGVGAHDRAVAVQIACNAYRMGASAARAIERGLDYLGGVR